MMYDKNSKMNKIQLRVGDLLVLYNTLYMPHDLQPKIIFPESLYASKQSQFSAQKEGEKSEYASTVSKN